MSRKIDDRIVQMQFDNRQFEDGIKTSTKSLDNLKQGLNLDGASRSLNNLNQAGRSFSLDGVSDGVEHISNRFSTLGIVGMSVLHNLTQGAMSFARRAANSVVGPILEGGKQRALNIEQAKFQFKGLGMDVEKAMDDALYAVKGTAYGLDEAAIVASSLGASGIKLGEEMKGSLRGVSGVAAMTNRTYGDIGRIFTTVAGQGKLMTMQLRQFESSGLNVAAAMAENMGLTEATVRDMVTKGQIDFKTFSTVMNDTFGEHATKANETYTGSLSNLRAAFSRIGASLIAPKLEATRKVFNALTPVVDDLAAAFAPMVKWVIKLMNLMSARTVKFLEGINLDNFTASVKQASTNITKFLYGGKGNLENIKRSFAGLSAALDILKMAFGGVIKIGVSILKFFAPVGVVLLGVTAKLGDALVHLRDFIKGTSTIMKPLVGVKNIFVAVAEGIRGAVVAIIDGIASFGNKSDKGPLNKFSDNMSKTLSGMETFAGLAGKIAKAFAKLAMHITDGFQHFNFKQLFDLINGGMFAAILLGLKKMVDNVSGIFGKAGGISKSLTNVTNILDSVKDSLTAYQTQLKAGALKQIAIAIGILAASIWVLSGIDPVKMGLSMAAITGLFIELFGAMALFDKIVGGVGFKSMASLTTGMIGLSAAILLLSFAMRNLSNLDWEGVAKGLVSVGVLTGILVGAARLLDTNQKRMIRGATSFVIFSAAILVLTQSVKQLAALDVGALTKGLVGVAVLMGEIVIFTKLADRMGVTSGIGIFILATAITILASAVKKFSAIKPEDLKKGLIALGVLLAEIIIFTKLTGGSGGLISTSIGLTILGGAMVIFTKVIKDLGSLKLKTIGKGLGTLAASLLILGLALKLMSTSIPGALALSVASASLVVLAGALKIMGSMSIDAIGRSLLLMAGAFTTIGLAALILTPVIPSMLALAGAIALIGLGSLAAGAGLLAVSAGLSALAISGAAGAAALVVIVSSIIGLIPALFKQVGEGILALAAVISNGAPILAGAFVQVFVAILETFVEATPRIIEAGVTLILLLLGGMADNIGKIVKVAVDLIVKFIDAISTQLPRIVQAGFDLMISFINSLSDAVTKNATVVSDAMWDLGDAMIDALVQNLLGGVTRAVAAVKNLGSSILNGFKGVLGIKSPSKEFMGAADSIVDGLVKGLTKGAPEAVAAAESLAVTPPTDDFKPAGSEAGNLYSSGLTESKPKAKTAGKKLADEALKGIRETAALISVKEGKYLADGIVIGMVSKKPDVYEASKFLAQAIKDGLIEETPRFEGIGDTHATAFLDGLTEDEIIAKAWAAGVQISSSAWQGAQSTAEQMAAAGTAAGQAYINGLNQAAANAQSIMEKVNRGDYQDQRRKEQGNISKGLAYSLNEISKLTDKEAETYWAYASVSNKMAKTAVENMRKATEGLDTSPTIKPVLDLSNVKDGAKDISSLLNTNSINVSKANIKAGNIAAATSDSSTTAPAQTQGNVNYNFTQNNHSPEALSRLDIYRQTKNQFSAWKEGVLA